MAGFVDGIQDTSFDVPVLSVDAGETLICVHIKKVATILALVEHLWFLLDAPVLLAGLLEAIESLISHGF